MNIENRKCVRKYEVKFNLFDKKAFKPVKLKLEYKISTNF